ncbi:MAG: ParA family protein [Deltaproteobacteria bacterium]|nr:ParA family protein [Deltaproteobacteria bacterium]
MDNAKYPRKRLVELLGTADEALRELETSGALATLGGPRDSYSPAVLSSYRRALGTHPQRQVARRQLFLNFKGGTGKTSLSVSYAHRLAELGHRVLLVDLDSQGHASKCVGFEAEECEVTLFDVLVKSRPVRDVAVPTVLEELHLLPSNLRMSTVDLSLMPMTNRERRMQRALDAVTEDYDFVIMDAPPSFGLLNLNALIACHDLIVPVLPDFLSFHGLKLLFETLDDLAEDMDHRLDRIFIAINQYNPTTTIARTARSALEQHYPEHILPMVIRQCTKFAQASGEGVPIFLFDPSSKAAEDIDALIAHTRLDLEAQGAETPDDNRVPPHQAAHPAAPSPTDLGRANPNPSPSPELDSASAQNDVRVEYAGRNRAHSASREAVSPAKESIS